MICPFCGKEYEEAATEKTCSGCAMFGGCHKTRCPHCSYETPKEPKLLQSIKRWAAKFKTKVG